jgi:hypothetical protein
MEEVMILDKVVVRLKDKSIMKGRTSDFYVDRTEFHLKLLTGKLVRINISESGACMPRFFMSFVLPLPRLSLGRG